MTEKCILCGEPLENGKCPNASTHFKKMCLNCKFCERENDNHFCMNDENQADFINRIKMANTVQGPYEIVNVEIKPLPLKDASKKCARWTVDEELVINFVKSIVSNA